MSNRKRTPTTFAQIMQQKERMDNAYERYDKANGKYHALINRFPECRHKLIEHEGKLYVVNCRPDRYSWSGGKMEIDYQEVVTDE